MPSARDRRQQRTAGWEDWQDDGGGDPGWSLHEMDQQVFGALKEINTGYLTPDRAIARTDDHVIVIGDKLRWTPTGLQISGELLPDEWIQVFELIRRVQSGIQWIIGDWLVYGDEKLGKTYKELAEITGYNEKTLRNLAYVARRVSMSLRKDTLSFGHHNLVASLPEPGQVQWLDYAVREGLSVAALAKVLNNTPNPQDTPERRFRRDMQRVFRITASGTVPRGEKRTEALESVHALRAWLDDIERWLEGNDHAR